MKKNILIIQIFFSLWYQNGDKHQEQKPHLPTEREREREEGSLIKTYSNVLPRVVGASNGMLTSASHILYHFIALGLCFNLHTTIEDGGEISLGLISEAEP